MDGQTRITALGTLLSYLPPSALGRIEQLPSLLIAFLCHAPQSVVEQWLPFWSKSMTSMHAVSGVWLGLPGRESAAALRQLTVTQVSGQTILLGLFIFLRERLFEYGVPPKYTDGLLFTCFNSLLRHTEGEVELRLPDVKTREYAELIQLQQKAHAKTLELVAYLRGVLSHQAQPSLELSKAMRIAAQHERLTRYQSTKALVEPPGRIWAYKFLQPLKLEQVRQLLILHDCVTQFKELAELPSRDTRLYFRIDATSAISVLSSMESVALQRTFFVELADREQSFTIIGVFTEDFWAHVRWGMYWTMQRVLWEQNNTFPHVPEWSPLSYALVVTQLWFSRHTEHHCIAVAILRDWAGLFPRGSHMFVTEVAYLRDRVMPTLLARYTTPQIWQLLPVLLAFDFEHDRLMRIETKETPVFPASTHTDKVNLRLWYQLMDYISTTVDPGASVERVLRFFKFTALSPLQPVSEFKQIPASKSKDSNGPYAPYNLETQFRRVHPCRFNVCECKQDEKETHRTWHVFALLEQQRTSKDKTVIYPLPDIGSTGSQHLCLHMCSWPIAHASSEYEERLIYCDTYFPVAEIDRKHQAASLDIPDQYYFIRAAYRDWIGDSQIIHLPAQPEQMELPFRLALMPPAAEEEEEERKREEPKSRKRKSPPAPDYSPEADGEEEESNGKSDKRSSTRLKVTHQSITKETMSVAWDFGSSTDL